MITDSELSSTYMSDSSVQSCLSGFTDMECRSIVVLGLKLICADNTIHPLELVSRRQIFGELGITTQQEFDLPTYSEALQVYQSMSDDKRVAVKQALSKLAISDGISTEDEERFIKSLD